MEKYFNLLYQDTFLSYTKLLQKKLKNKEKSFIVTVNPETIISAEKETEINKMLLDKNTSLVPDGIIIVKAAHKLKIPIKERITGIDISSFLLEEANRNSYSLYLFGAKEEVINALVEKIKTDYPNINLVGYSDGYVKNKDEIMQDIINKEPDICLVGLGIPMQEKLIYKYISKAKKGIYIGVGGSLDVLSGTKKRAPKLFIKLNLEWLYRLLKEPSRIKRFWNNNIKFLLKINKLKPKHK
ncbi:MAG: WecB/TagA/CpsF family glycosyltransferase [Ruminococcus sp.]|nr:WecB/TagA/CpsF family glycosyltransferase [Ruminococcus sp.]